MIARTALAALAAAAAVWGGITLTAADASRAAEAPVVQEDEEGNPELAAYMKDVGRTMRALGRGLREENAMETGLAEVVRLERGLVDAKELLPITVTSIEDEAERARAALEWRAEMHEMFRGLLELEMAYAKGDADAVLAQLKALDAHKKEGHDRFK